jgi:hypothetical protein
MLEDRTLPAVFSVLPGVQSLASAVRAAAADADGSNTINLAPGAYPAIDLSAASIGGKALALAGAGPGVTIASASPDTALVVGGNVNLTGVSVSGNTVVSGGTLTIGPGVRLGGLTLESGAACLNADLSVTTLTVLGGTLTGPGNLSVSGPAVWAGGTLAGAGGTTLAGSLTIGAADGSPHAETLDGRALTVTGPLSEAGGGTFTTLGAPAVTLPQNSPLRLPAAPGSYAVAYQQGVVNGLDPILNRTYNSKGVLTDLAAVVDHADGSFTNYEWQYDSTGDLIDVTQELTRADTSFTVDDWQYSSAGAITRLAAKAVNADGSSTSDTWNYGAGGVTTSVTDAVVAADHTAASREWDYNSDGSFKKIVISSQNATGAVVAASGWYYTGGVVTAAYEDLYPPGGVSSVYGWNYDSTGALTSASESLNPHDGGSTTINWQYQSGVLASASETVVAADQSVTHDRWSFTPSTGASSAEASAYSATGMLLHDYQWFVNSDGSRTFNQSINLGNGNSSVMSWSYFANGTVSQVYTNANGATEYWNYNADGSPSSTSESYNVLGTAYTIVWRLGTTDELATAPDKTSVETAWRYDSQKDLIDVTQTDRDAAGNVTGSNYWSDVTLDQAPLAPGDPGSPPTDPSVQQPTAPSVPAAPPPDTHAPDPGGMPPAPAAPTDYLKVTTPTAVSAGAPFDVTATVYTTLDDTVDTTYQGKVTITLQTDPNGNTVLGGTTQIDVTGGSGVVDFATLTLNRSGQGYVLEATADAAAAARTNPFDALPFVWTGKGPDSAWSDGQNWAGGAAPVAGADLVFPAGAEQLDTVNDLGATYASVSVSDDYTFSGDPIAVSGDLTFAAGSSTLDDSATVGGNTNIAAGAGLSVGAGSTLTDGFNVNGSLTLLPGGAAALTATGAVGATGTVTVGKNAKLTVGTGTVANVAGHVSVLAQGDVDVDGGGTLNWLGGSAADVAGTINGLPGSTLAAAANSAQSLESSAVYDLSGGYVQSAGSSLTAADGSTVELAPGASGTIAGRVTLANLKVTGTAAAGASLELAPGAVVSADSQVNVTGGSVTMDSNAALTLSNANANISGSLSQAGGAALLLASGTKLELGPNSNCTLAGQVTTASGTAVTLDGNSNCTLAAGGSWNSSGKVTVANNGHLTTAVNSNYNQGHNSLGVYGLYDQYGTSAIGGDAAFQVGSNGSIDLHGKMDNKGNGSVNLGGKFDIAGGDLELDGGAIRVNGKVVGTGMVSYTSTISDNDAITVEATGLFDVTGALVEAAGGRLTDYGTVIIESGATFENQTGCVIAPGGILTLNGVGTLDAGSSLDNFGTLAVATGGRLNVAGTVVNEPGSSYAPSGSVSVGAGGSLIPSTAPGYGTPAFVAAGAVTIPTGTASYAINGQLTGGVPSGETVQVTLAGLTQSATLDSSGNFSTTFDTSALDPADSPYSLGFAYAGDASNFGAFEATTLMVADPVTPTFDGFSAPAITYGAATAQVSGHLGGTFGGQPVPAGETVTVTLGGVTQTATLDASDHFTASFDAHTLTASGAPYSVALSYAGDADFTAASGGGALTVNQAAPTFAGLSAPVIGYGTASTVVSGALQANAGASSIPAGESVQVTLDGLTQTALLAAGGAFTTTFDTHALPLSPSGYAIGFSYAGDGNFAASSGGSTLTVTPGPVDPTTSVVSVSSGSVAAGSPVTVTFTARDAGGNRLKSGGSVVVFALGSAAGGQGSFGQVTDNKDGTYTATFSGALAGDNTVTATVDSRSVTTAAPTVKVTPGPVSPAASAVTAKLGSVQLGGTTTVTLQARDAFGNLETAGGLTVAFALTGTAGGNGTLGPVADNHDGTYTAVFTGTADGSTAITATVNGSPITSGGTSVGVTLDAFSAAKSTLKLAAATVASGTSTTITLQAEDAKGVKEVSGGLTVAFQLVSTKGGQGSFGPVIDNGNGTYTATFTGALSGSNTIAATIDGIRVTSRASAVMVTPGAVSLARSVVTLSAPSVRSGSPLTVTLQAEDAAGNKLTTGGLKVAFALTGPGGGSGTFGPVRDDRNGTYTATFTGAVAGANAITATVGGQPVTSTPAAVSVTPGAASPARSFVTIAAATVSSGGTTTVTLQAEDAAGNKLTTGGLAVAFLVGGRGAGQGTFGKVTDNKNGTYTATFTGTLAGANTITATVNRVKLSAAGPSVQVTPGLLSLAKSTVSLSAATVAPGGTVTVTLQAEDAAGNKLTTGGLTVLFLLEDSVGGGGTFGPVADNGNGTYTATFKGTTAGRNVISAKVNGQLLTSTGAAVKIS